MNKLEEVKKYRNDPAHSQSFLKSRVINQSPDKDFKGSVATLLGNLTDTILCLEDYVEDLYYVSDIQVYPKPQVKFVWDEFYKQLVESGGDLEIDNFHLLEIYRAEYENNYKDQTVLDKIMEGEYYWDDLCNSSGKTVVSQEYWDKSVNAANSIRTNESTYKYFYPGEGIEILYQVPLYWKYTDPMDGWSYNCKGLLDIVYIDHNTKQIQVADIKTTGDSLKSWKYNIARKFRYEFQLSYYNYGLKKWAEDKYPDYEVINPCLIVENIDFPGNPRIFNLTALDLDVGGYGCTIDNSTVTVESRSILEIPPCHIHGTRQIMGWQQAIEKYHQCQELGLDDFNLDYHLTKGIDDLNLWL